MSSKEPGNQPGELPPPAWVVAINTLSRLFGIFAAGLILASVFVVCEMVFVRAVLGQSSIWQTEFVTFSLVAATFIGAPYILLTRGHVSVDVLPLMSTVPTRRVLHFAGYAVGLVFCLLFLYSALPWWYETWKSGQTTPSIWRARLWIPYLAVPVGLALLSLEMIAEMWMVLSRRQLPFGLRADETI